MTSAEFTRALSDWFAANARDLPWRKPVSGHRLDPWHVLVSEFMLQQTQVERVIPQYEAWIRTWPRPVDLAAASPADALRMWGRLGYPRRALWLHRAAGQIVDRFQGQVPSDPAELESLTGIGPYTARAVSVFAFGQRHPVVDTNTRRVLARAVAGLAAAGNPSPTDLVTQESVLPDDTAQSVTVNAAMMELGQTVCTAKRPRCEVCPIAQWCQWRLAGYPENAPKKRPAQKQFQGSDRQARGKVMAVLREAEHAVSREAAASAASSDATQAQRAIDSLLSDGLIVEVSANKLALPGS